MDASEENTGPIINCHTHVFTVKDVPPFLARTIIPWPFYFLIRTSWFAGLVGVWVRLRFALSRKKWYKELARGLYRLRMNLKRYLILRLIKLVVGVLIIISLFHSLYDPWLSGWLEKQGIHLNFLGRFDDWLEQNGILIITDSWVLKAILVIILLLFFPSGRNLIFFILRQVNRFFKMLPGKQTTELLRRYLNIVRYANYKEQFKVYSRLRLQYPPGSAMVILPMDMEFMGAGKPSRSFDKQMEMLAKIKENHPDEFLPFLFVDPRRGKAGGKDFFTYTIEKNKIVLGDCFVKDYIETKDFSGFKIYPALGYFPFDETLLPLWKYAADNGIPIMTHCIRGVIYYRGKKQSRWDFHPVFEQYMGSDENYDPNDYSGLLLPQMKPVDVQEIFTHPMNYACLYKKELLAKLVAVAKDPRVKEIFGYNEESGSISRGLSHLKLCFGHFGGEDEWKKFFEKDRTNFGHQLVNNPAKGIDFLYTNGERKRGKPEQVWKTADWYSIICSLMLQHDHVYADISYILHGDLEILPLLRDTLQHSILRKRVLYGSDFYVVRNHKSDKNMLADIKGGLLKDEFDLIARKNPLDYLKKGPVEEKPERQ
jgi:hypothetical protein